jgi:hypothetical protein
MSDQPNFVMPAAAGAPDASFARFYLKPVQNNFRTEQEGRPIFEDKEYVEISFPGDRRSIVDRLVKAEDRTRWPQQYKAFKEDLEQVGEGLPLSEWAAMTRSQVEEYKFFRVRTLEQMAGISDGVLSDMPMGTRELRDQAQRWLAAAAGAQPTAALAAEVSRKDDRIVELEAQLAEARAAQQKGKTNGA